MPSIIPHQICLQARQNIGSQILPKENCIEATWTKKKEQRQQQKRTPMITMGVEPMTYCAFIDQSQCKADVITTTPRDLATAMDSGQSMS
jgi:hypothetical protein